MHLLARKAIANKCAITRGVIAIAIASARGVISIARGKVVDIY